MSVSDVSRSLQSWVLTTLRSSDRYQAWFGLDMIFDISTSKLLILIWYLDISYRYIISHLTRYCYDIRILTAVPLQLGTVFCGRQQFVQRRWRTHTRHTSSYPRTRQQRSFSATQWLLWQSSTNPNPNPNPRFPALKSVDVVILLPFEGTLPM